MASIQDWGNILGAVGGIIVVFGGGIFAALSIFDRGKKDRDKEADSIDERVIKGLKDELAILTAQYVRIDSELKIIKEENIRVVSENKTLREILQGRDEATIKYQARGVQAMDKIDVIYDSLHRLLDSLERLTEKETEIKKFETTETVTTIHPNTHPKAIENGPVSS